MSLEDKVSDQISEWTDDEVMFTAFDVTVALRNGGERVEHRDVRKIVHQMHSDQDFSPSYQKVMISIPNIQWRQTQNTNEKAFLFHHINSDTLKYEPLKPTYTTSSPAKPASKTPTTSSAISQRQGVRNKQPVNGVLSCAYPKYDGSLTIPSVLLDDSGLKGHAVAIFHKDNKVVISSTAAIATSGGTPEVKKPKSSNVLIIPRRILKPLAKNTYVVSLSSNGKEIHVE